MKSRHMEALARSQRLYHQRTSWRGNRDGLYISHSYEGTTRGGPSWSDDFQFILSGRRVNVWWIHPRMEYWDEIDTQAKQFVELPQEPGRFEDTLAGKHRYRTVGRSRKRLVDIELSPMTASEMTRADAVVAARKNLEAVGIDHEVTPHMRRERTAWSICVELCAPFEIRSAEDLPPLAALVRRLLRFETTLTQEFPGYVYGRTVWLREGPSRRTQNAQRNTDGGASWPDGTGELA